MADMADARPEIASQGRCPSPLIDISIEGSQAEVRPFLRRVMEALEPLCLTAEESAAVELVLAEALNNVFEHAYGGDETPQPVALSCCHRCDGLHVTLIDSGRPMPGRRLPLGRCRPVGGDLADLPEGGFGWFLIRNLTQDLSYLRVGGENHLHLRLDVGRRGARH